MSLWYDEWKVHNKWYWAVSEGSQRQRNPSCTWWRYHERNPRCSERSECARATRVGRLLRATAARARRRHAPPAPAPHAGSTARCTPSRPAATTCHRCSLTHRTNIDVFCQEFVRRTGPAGVARTARRGEPVLRAASRICLGGFLRAPATRHLQRRVLRKVRAARPCHIANMLMTSVSLASLYF